MNGFIRLVVIVAMIATFTGCASTQSQNDELGAEDGLADANGDVMADASASVDGGSSQAATPSGGADDFSDFSDTAAGDTAEADTSAAANPPAADGELSIDDEVAATASTETPPPEQAVETPAVPAPPAADPFETPAPEQAAELPPTPPAPEAAPAPEVAAQPEPSLPAPEVPASPTPAVPLSQTVEITNLKYQPNDAGGTLVLQATGPLVYTTRANPDLKQFVIEVSNAHLPNKLTRNLNTKDIKGTIGTVDAYQNAGSSTARFVIQLREGASDPVVQSEGNSLLIVSSGAGGGEERAAVANNESETDGGSSSYGQDTASTNVNLNDGKILSSQNLADFMSGNTKFYGKKISIETNNMDVREALKFITDESGVNMVIADEVKGNISLKLRQVPWDQALVMVMKTRKLGYTRQGNVLRIAPIADLRQEEDEAAKIAAGRKVFEQLKVRMFPISYGKVDDLEKKIKEFLSEKGKVIGDVRTNSLVVTDIEDNLNRVAKLISSLDQQPPQVLIESKIVEAQETFSRSVGVNWNFSGTQNQIGRGKQGPINFQPSLGVNPLATVGNNNMNFGLNIGTLDYLGNLTAALALSENEGVVKIISSPRIMTLSNEKSGITQTTEVPLKTIVTTTTGTQETIQFKPLTLKLEVTPQITSDASVIMNVQVNRQFQGAKESDGSFSVNSREASTKVLIKNGQTAVIGGIYQSDATDGVDGVPWAKDLPVIGSLFRKTTKTKQKIELLIFLTPRILGQVETAKADSTTSEF